MIYIAFNKKELAGFCSLREHNDIIFVSSEFLEKDLQEGIVDVTDIKVDWAPYVEEVRDFFGYYQEQNDIDLRGYANNFFECTLKILIQYASAINYYKKSHEGITFAQSQLIRGKPNYYLGEHESQGRFLYSRNFALQSSLEDFSTSLGLSLNYIDRIVNYQRLTNIIRDTSVFFVRFWRGIKPSFSNWKRKKNALSTKNTNLYVILRSYAQFSSIQGVLEEKAEPITVICADTFFGGSLENRLQGWAGLHPNVTLYSLEELGALSTTKEYIKTISRLLFTPNYQIKFDLFSVDVSQALREVIIMSAELNLYRSRLDVVLPETDSMSIFLSCEQKSPQAYIEACIANSKGFKTVQVMACDQAANDLPFPIVSDLFITDTLKRKVLFEKNWSTKLDKLRYLGPLRQVLSEPNCEKKTFDVCYFSHAAEVEQNQAIVELLDSFRKKQPLFDFCIKLHPRDKGLWIDHSCVERQAIFTSSNINNNELYNEFEIAISNPSAVVMDLLINLKPFIFIDTIPDFKHVDFVSCDEFYLGYTAKISSIDNILENRMLLYEDVKKLHKRVFGENPQQFNQACLRKVLRAENL